MLFGESLSMRHAMKILLTAYALLALTAGAQAATCLNTSQITGTDSKDGKTLTLRMRDGKVWQGELKGSCSEIRFTGFAWDVQGGRICENMQTLRTSQGGVCVLGKLTQTAAGNSVPRR
jgi:hypothetical protein